MVAFEPDAFNAWLLDRNLTVNDIDKVVINTCAVGSRCGTAHIHRYKSSNCGRHSLLSDHGLGSRTIPITHLDAALDACGLSTRRVLILKIDVEGYEPAVVGGAKQTLAHTDVVILEYSPDLSRSGGLSTDDMLDQLQGAGFVPHKIAAEGQIRKISVDDLRRLKGQLDIIWTR